MKGHIPLPLAKEHPLKFGATGGIAVFLIVFFGANYLYPMDQHQDRDFSDLDEIQQVNVLKDKIGDDLRTKYLESSVIPESAVFVQREGPRLADQMLQIDPENKVLGIRSVIRKYDYAAFAYALAAVVDGTTKSDGIALSHKSLDASKLALEYVRYVLESFPNSKAHEFVSASFTRERVLWCRALSLTNLAKITPTNAAIREAQAAVAQIPTGFKPSNIDHELFRWLEVQEPR